MNRNVIITCAVTGAGDTVGKHPGVPVTPRQIADACFEAESAGAASTVRTGWARQGEVKIAMRRAPAPGAA